MDDAAVDALYALPPQQFVAARDALARTLRAADDRKGAAQIKALKRPNLAAYALNRLTREHRSAVEELVEAGQAVRAAQQSALSGGDAALLREATRRRRAVLDRLVGLAGASAAHASGIRATLEAASLDTDAAAELLTGRLEHELEEPAGFGDVSGLKLVLRPDEDIEKRRRVEEVAKQAETDALRARIEADEAGAEADRLDAAARDARARARRLDEFARRAEAGALEARRAIR